MNILPDAGPSVACDLGESEEHDIMVLTASDWSVVWPVIGKVMDHFAFVVIWTVHHRLSDGAVWVIG